MLYDEAGFALALGRANGRPSIPAWFHFGRMLPDRDSVRALRERLVAEGVDIARSGTS